MGSGYLRGHTYSCRGVPLEVRQHMWHPVLQNKQVVLRGAQSVDTLMNFCPGAVDKVTLCNLSQECCLHIKGKCDLGGLDRLHSMPCEVLDSCKASEGGQCQLNNKISSFDFVKELHVSDKYSLPGKTSRAFHCLPRRHRHSGTLQQAPAFEVREKQFTRHIFVHKSQQ